MATWSNDKDATRDLDKLSVMTSGRQISKSVLPRQACRGKPVQIPKFADPFVDPFVDPFDDHDNFRGSHSGREGVMIGRGQMLKSMRSKLLNQKDSDLQDQLRVVMGPGYSNDYIEKHFGKNSSNESSAEQFEDADWKGNLFMGTATHGLGSSLERTPKSPPPLVHRPRKVKNMLFDTLANKKEIKPNSSILSITKLNPEAQPFVLKSDNLAVSSEDSSTPGAISAVTTTSSNDENNVSHT